LVAKAKKLALEEKELETFDDAPPVNSAKAFDNENF
jgi:hypothetical protein